MRALHELWRLSLLGLMVAALASLVGTYLAYMLWLGGAKYAPVSIASVLNQLHVIYTAILAALFLSERMTLRKAVAVALSIAGSTLVVLG